MTQKQKDDLAAAIEIVLNAAMENSCSCGVETPRVSKKTGHQTDCWVHNQDKLLDKVWDHIQQLRNRTVLVQRPK